MSTVNNSGSLNLHIVEPQNTATVVDTSAQNAMEVPKLEQWHYFPSVLYTIDKPEFLDTMTTVSQE